MKIRFLLLLIVGSFLQFSSFAQTPAKPYRIVIKGGHVIDPANNLNQVMDVAIQDGKIALVAKNIDPSKGVQVVDAKGMYVTPGLIDLHAHVFAGMEQGGLSNGSGAVVPDAHTFRVGVTTVVDAGGAGWKSFGTFKKNIIDRSQTRVLSMLNIVGEGMRGGAFEQDLNDMDAKRTADTAKAHRDVVVGFKLAHFAAADWTPVDRVVEAGKLADLPVMIDFGGDDSHPPMSIEELFVKHLRPGDIYTHTFTDLTRRDPIVDVKTAQLRPFVKPAQQKGIVFDVGYGSGSFDYRQALPAIKANFFPNTLGTDLHMGSTNHAMKSLLNMMSNFYALGMKLPEVVKASTWAPAQAIKRNDLGTLSVGAVADVAVLSMKHGTFGFWDRMGEKVEGKDKLECEMTIRNGRIVYDLNGIANPIVVNPARR